MKGSIERLAATPILTTSGGERAWQLLGSMAGALSARPPSIVHSIKKIVSNPFAKSSSITSVFDVASWCMMWLVAAACMSNRYPSIGKVGGQRSILYGASCAIVARTAQAKSRMSLLASQLVQVDGLLYDLSNSPLRTVFVPPEIVLYQLVLLIL